MKPGTPAIAPVMKVRSREEWHEDYGDVLWWTFPVTEPPYVGSPLDLGLTVLVATYVGAGKQIGELKAQVGGWPGYHTHWTEIPVPGI